MTLKKTLAQLALVATIALSTPAWANKTAQEVLASGSTAEEKGNAVAYEADIRDLGYGDTMADVEMVLYNAHGQKTSRKMRNLSFELPQKGVGDKTLIIFDTPRDIKGTAFLTFSKILDPDDQWMYLPALGRSKRISSKNKSGPFMGSEFAYEDISSQEVGKYKYKYLRNEACGERDCFVLERYPLYKFSGYTRQVVWLDTKEFLLIKMDFYDRKNSLLKTMSNHDYQQFLGQYWRPGKMSMVNHQNGKSTDLIWKNYAFKVGLVERDFTKAKLKNVK